MELAIIGRDHHVSILKQFVQTVDRNVKYHSNLRVENPYTVWNVIKSMHLQEMVGVKDSDPILPNYFLNSSRRYFRSPYMKTALKISLESATFSSVSSNYCGKL